MHREAATEDTRTWRLWTLVPLVALIALATVAQFLRSGEVPITPGNDLAKHAAMVVNFVSAFHDGQLIPRMQPLPHSIPDIPIFQFYGSMSGLLSMPFLETGLPPVIALTLAVWVARLMGALAICATGRLMGANRASCLLAAMSYLLTPYILSNLYGRVANPEAIAHGIVPILIYGLVRMAMHPNFVSAAAIVLSVLGLALAHPIFLLYGCLAGGLFALCAFHFRAMAPVVIVLVGGFLAASFQWLPAFELAEHFSYMLNNPSGRSAFLTSPSGFYEMPQSLAEYYPHPNEDERQFISRLYLTGGILTIPILLLLLLRLKDRISLAAFLSAATFLFLSFSPIDVWRFLPKFTWAVQFPYRLLSVTALFVALGICLTIKRMKHWEFALLITLLLIQSWNLLLMPPYSSRLPVPQRDIPDAFASLDYLILPKPLFASNDRWVISHNLPIVADKFPWRENIVDSRSHLIKDNFLRLPSQVKQRYVRIIGAVEDEQTSKSLWIAGSSNPDVPIDGLRAVGPGEFDVVFRIPAELIDVTIQSDAASRPAVPMEGKFAETKNIRLKTVDFLAGNRIEVPADGPKFLWLLGSSVFTEAIDVWLADPARPAIPVSDPISIGPGAFEIWLKLPEQPGEYTLVSSRYLVPAIADSRSSDFRRLSIAVSARMLVADATTPIRVISADLVERQSSHGYTRNFHVLPAARRAGYDNTGGHVELPIAYNPLFTVSQRGSILRGQPTDTGHLLVATKDLDSPFVVQFRLPWIIWPTTALGFIFIFIGILAGRRS